MHRQSTVSIRLIKMKKLFEVITTFLCINFVTPVVMYYIYDDNPTVGFVGVDNVVGEYVANYNAPKKPFTQPYGSRFQKYTNERVVDSHFKLMKSPSRYALPTLMDRNNAQRRHDHRNTVPPKGWQQNNPQARTTVNRQHQQQQQQQKQQQPQQQQQQSKQQQINPQTNNSPMAFHNKPAKSSYTMDPRRTDSQQHKDINIKDNIIQPLRPQTVNPEYTSPMKQRPRSPDSVYDPKSNFVQVNVRKTQILQDPQKLVRLNNNIQLKAASVLSSQNERQRIPTSMIMDKTLHKSNNGLGDHNLQAMSQVLDGITQQVSDRRHNKRENRIDYKQPSLDVIDKNKRSFVFDSMKKYIGKNITVTKERADRKAIQMARVGSNEESLEVNETPYALFYRMNPESVDQQEAVVLLRSMEANGSHDLNSSERRRSNDWDFKNTASKTINNSAKRLHKQMQLLNNFGNQK